MYINTMGAIVIGIVICIVFITFLILALKKQKICKNLDRGNISKKLDTIERIDTLLSILIWCEVVLFIGLFLVL
jgi:hypothetical protein